MKRHCEKAQIAFPAKLSRQITSRQVKDLIYSLALGIRNNLTNGSEESRYLYLPIFRFKSESIVTQFLNSYTLYRNPNSRVAPRGLKCSVRYFDKICENLDTRPVFLKHLINNISRSFYARENKLGHFHLRHNLSDAYYFAKVLCTIGSSKRFTLCVTHFKILHQKMSKYILCSQFLFTLVHWTHV